jgi:hypothetical protein
MVKDLFQQNTTNASQLNPLTQVIYTGEVIDVSDELDAFRIKVYVPGLDTGKNNDDIPLCIPINKLFVCLPKVGECVLVLLSDPTKPFSARYWLGNGPMISQYQKVKEDGYATAKSISDQRVLAPQKAISTIPSANGNFPVNDVDKYDLSIIGRGNTDVQLKDNKLIFRCGIYNEDNPIIANNTNPAYIMLRNIISTDDNKISTTSTSIVSDQINLISHKSERITNIKLTDDDLQKIQDAGYSLMRGEEVIILLKKFIDAFNLHIHKHIHEVQTESEELKELLSYDFDKLINKYIKIN